MASKLTNPAQRFILHWGEMGIRWGINRSVGQIHALLYLSEEPIPAEIIADTLEIARSNVSTSLRELQSWGLVRIVHLQGDRRDHFQTILDPWEMFRRIADERKKRELDATAEVVKECIAEMKQSKSGSTFQLGQLEAMEDFFDTVFGFYSHLQGLSLPLVKRFARMGAKVVKLLG